MQIIFVFNFSSFAHVKVTKTCAYLEALGLTHSVKCQLHKRESGMWRIPAMQACGGRKKRMSQKTNVEGEKRRPSGLTSGLHTPPHTHCRHTHKNCTHLRFISCLILCIQSEWLPHLAKEFIYHFSYLHFHFFLKSSSKLVMFKCLVLNHKLLLKFGK